MPLHCYRCGASLAALSLPIERRDTCPECRVELHVCRMCTYFAPNRSPHCTNEDAEEVRDATVANFCDYFSPSPAAYTPAQREAEADAEAELAALFGEDTGRDDDATEPGLSKQDELARREAESLFRK